jgi:phospholipid/cholesterol/gamma-HCH transport system substrate-binding protein
MANLRDATAELDRAVASADTAMASIGHAASGADKTFSDLGQQVGPLISDLRQTSKAMKEMADQVGGMVAENREPLHNFSGTASIEFTGLLSDMRDLVNHLDRLTSEIERDPARFFFGNQQQGYDANKK